MHDVNAEKTMRLSGQRGENLPFRGRPFGEEFPLRDSVSGTL